MHDAGSRAAAAPAEASTTDGAGGREAPTRDSAATAIQAGVRSYLAAAHSQCVQLARDVQQAHERCAHSPSHAARDADSRPSGAGPSQSDALPRRRRTRSLPPPPSRERATCMCALRPRTSPIRAPHRSNTDRTAGRARRRQGRRGPGRAEPPSPRAHSALRRCARVAGACDHRAMPGRAEPSRAGSGGRRWRARRERALRGRVRGWRQRRAAQRRYHTAWRRRRHRLGDAPMTSPPPASPAGSRVCLLAVTRRHGRAGADGGGLGARGAPRGDHIAALTPRGSRGGLRGAQKPLRGGHRRSRSGLTGVTGQWRVYRRTHTVICSGHCCLAARGAAACAVVAGRPSLDPRQLDVPPTRHGQFWPRYWGSGFYVLSLQG